MEVRNERTYRAFEFGEALGQQRDDVVALFGFEDVARVVGDLEGVEEDEALEEKVPSQPGVTQLRETVE